MAKKIVGLMPPHETYVEPFGGGAAVLLAKPRANLEIYNDLDGDMVTLFRVLRDKPDELMAAIALTPFARAEHELSYTEAETDVERARRVLVRSHFGFGSSGIHRTTGFRAAGLRAGSLPVHGWTTMPDTVRATSERVRGVVIEQRPAIQVMRDHDSKNTVFYVDPPYLPETRDRGADYRHEMNRQDHADLLTVLRELRGRVIISGYTSPMYDDAMRDWRRLEVAALADGAGRRTEVLWLNFEDQTGLFGWNR